MVLSCAQLRQFLPRSIPIIGINLGRLGFLTELSTSEVMEQLPRLLSGEGWVDERAMLEAELNSTGTKDEPPPIFHALNDVVVARGAVARLITVDTQVNNEPLITYRGDGVIVATATGSTGYSLAANGPVIYPQGQELLLVPIMPHLIAPHAIVLSPESIIKLRLTTTHQATLSIDGHINISLSDGASIVVSRCAVTTNFLRIHPQSNFYRTLDQRLKGKQ